MTELIRGYGYNVIAEIIGEDEVFYGTYGGYEGEWLLITFNKHTTIYSVFKGYYGSCSYCDSLEAFGYDHTKEEWVEWIDDYRPFVMVPLETVLKLHSMNSLVSILPANMRGYFNIVDDYQAIADEIVKHFSSLGA